MRFILMISEDEKSQDRAPADLERMVEQHQRFGQELRAQGKWLDAGRLRPASEAVTIRMTAGKFVLTDGPFAETKEAVGGFYVVECESKDEAIEWAKKLPAFEYGAVEVRALF